MEQSKIIDTLETYHYYLTSLLHGVLFNHHSDTSMADARRARAERQAAVAARVAQTAPAGDGYARRAPSSVATEASGGGTPDLFSSMIVLGYMDIYIYIGERCRSGEPQGAREGGGAPPCLVATSKLP